LRRPEGNLLKIKGETYALLEVILFAYSLEDSARMLWASSRKLRQVISVNAAILFALIQKEPFFDLKQLLK